MSVHLQAAGIGKVFNRRTIFDGIAFSVHTGQTMLISGRNGSGKSTLIKIISDVLAPTVGTITLSVDDIPVKHPRVQFLGLVSPYLTLYDEFTAQENLRFALMLRGLRDHEATEVSGVLARVGLAKRMDDPVRTYSSGMKQRLKYAFALVHRPPVVLLDEPMANLDEEGIRMVRDVMADYQELGILVVATNDLTDVNHVDIHIDLNAAR